MNFNALFFAIDHSLKRTKFHQSSHQIGKVHRNKIQMVNVLKLRNLEKAFKW